jgi:hypothetical protein
MKPFTTLVPAYGRDYKSKAAVMKDWTGGKDFQCAITGGYASSQDITWPVRIRYNRHTKILLVENQND